MARAQPTIGDYLLLALLAAIFGGSFVLISQASASIPVLSLVAGRLMLALIIFLILMRFVGQTLPAFGRIWISITASAIFGNALPFYLITLGQQKVDAGLAAILISVMPLMTVFLAHFFTADEKINRYKLIGFGLGVIGIVVLIGADKLLSFGTQSTYQFAILAAALCYAINTVIVKSMAKLPRYGTIGAVLLMSVIVILPFALIIERPWQLTFTTHSVVALITLGVVATAFGNFLRFEIAKRQGATFLAQNNYLMPMFGVFWAWLILSQQVPANAIFALVLILVGVAITRMGNKSVQLHKAVRS